MIDLIKKLASLHDLTDDELREILSNDKYDSLLREEADKIRQENYGRDVYIRGLIEISNYCKNNCFYCGIRGENKNLTRYRLTKDDILSCCEQGYLLGFRTFVMQGGEDPYFTDDIMVDIISSVREKYSDCAITLSLGEKSKETYKKYFDAGANRYLLRHETATDEHYKMLHPHSMSLENRKKCLFDLKEIGFQTGSGFMVGSPYQTAECLAKDLKFIEEFQPDMCGIGPFIPHSATPFSDRPAGSVELTCFLLSVIRLIKPNILLPATTALGSINEGGREKGILYGANVIMPNLSPMSERKKYSLYNNKLFSGNESAQEIDNLAKSMESIGYSIVCERGDIIK